VSVLWSTTATTRFTSMARHTSSQGGGASLGSGAPLVPNGVGYGAEFAAAETPNTQSPLELLYTDTIGNKSGVGWTFFKRWGMLFSRATSHLSYVGSAQCAWPACSCHDGWLVGWSVGWFAANGCGSRLLLLPLAGPLWDGLSFVGHSYQDHCWIRLCWRTGKASSTTRSRWSSCLSCLSLRVRGPSHEFAVRVHLVHDAPHASCRCCCSQLLSLGT